MIICPNCDTEVPAAAMVDVDLAAYGLRVQKWGQLGWVLEWLDDEGTWSSLQIGDHGGVAPTRAAAVLEAARRIASGQFVKATT